MIFKLLIFIGFYVSYIKACGCCAPDRNSRTSQESSKSWSSGQSFGDGGQNYATTPTNSAVPNFGSGQNNSTVPSNRSNQDLESRETNQQNSSEGLLQNNASSQNNGTGNGGTF